MKIEVFTICYNEEVRLPYFLRHYSFADKITVFDNYSTDKSDEICEGKVTVIKYDSANTIRDDLYIDIKNNCWKESKADWVIVCDIDELVYHPNIYKILSESKASVYNPPMFDMISETLPTTDGNIYEELKYGVKGNPKMLIFKPKDVLEINYGAGCHDASPVGNIILSEDDLITLHYQYLQRAYTIARYKEFASRLSETNKINRWSFHYEFPEEKINAIFDQKLIKVI